MSKAINKSINKPLFIIIFTLLLTGITLLTSSQPIWANIPINIIMPIFILLTLDTVFFEKLKLSTLVVMRILILFVIFGYMSGELFVKINLIFLAINIMEATLTDFKRQKYYNSLIGLLLAVTIIFIRGTWINPYYTITTGSNIGMICWVIVYTIWNWIFVTNEFSASIALYHVGILSTPILGMLIFKDPGMWLMFRAYSLTTGGNIQIAKKQYLEKALESDKFSKFVMKTKDNKVQIILMVLNIVLLGLMVATRTK